ncbi:MAG: DUF2933 domain-containing protein [Candidatus Rokubacteria bacterium]|nr:DUF2933 domain-containing protein [Candidatus Rokubacteria bacterium]
MTERSREQRVDLPVSATNGVVGAGPEAAAGYCGYCGQAIISPGPSLARFEARIRAAADGTATATEAGNTAGQEAGASVATGSGPGGWKWYLKMAACCGAPLLALIVLAGGGGALLGAAGAVLPLLAFLACPLAMLFMMRGMMKSGHRGGDGRKDEPDR